VNFQHTSFKSKPFLNVQDIVIESLNFLPCSLLVEGVFWLQIVDQLELLNYLILGQTLFFELFYVEGELLRPKTNKYLFHFVSLLAGVALVLKLE
jgi:hypothetical protein